jgi:hypothetical protein
VANHFQGKVAFWREGPEGLEPVDFPVTNLVLVAERP